MTFREIISFAPTLQRLVTQPLPLRKAYQLSKIVKKTNEEIVFFETESAKIRKMEIPQDEAVKKIDELLALDVPWDLPSLELEEGDNVSLSCAELESAYAVIKLKMEE